MPNALYYGDNLEILREHIAGVNNLDGSAAKLLHRLLRLGQELF